MKDKLDMVRISLKNDRTYFSDKQIVNEQVAVDVIIDELKDLDRECFIVLNLDTKGKPINATVNSIGDISSSVVNPREAFKSSLLSSASSVIIMHNHPSGNLIPSQDDISVTTRMRACGKVLGIPVVDHILFNPQGEHISMRDVSAMMNDELYDNALVRGVLQEREFDYEDKTEIDSAENDENSGFRIYRKIEGKGVYIHLNDAEMWQVYQEEMYKGYLKYIKEDLAERQRSLSKSIVCGVKAGDILSDERLLWSIAYEYSNEVSYALDDEVLERAYMNTIPGYISMREEEDMSEKIDELSESEIKEVFKALDKDEKAKILKLYESRKSNLEL